MKYLLAFVTITLLQFNLIAQDTSTAEPKSYSKFVGGTFFMRSEMRNTPPRFFYQELSVNTNPYFGIDFTKRLSAGAFLQYGFEKLAYNPDNNFQGEEYRKIHTYGAGLFARTYLNDGNFRFFVESQLSYSRILEKTEGPTIDVLPLHSGLFQIGIRPSFSYTINRLRLIASFGSLSYFNYSDTTYDLLDEKVTAEEGYSVILLSLRPRNFNFGAEFLF